MTFTKPPVGSLVTVTTRHPEHLVYATSPWRDTTYTGRVLPPEPWFKGGQFRITSDDPRMRHRVIDTAFVHDMSINGANGSTREDDQGTQVVEVKGSRGGKYWVTIKDGGPVSCTCPGFTYRRDCRHLSEATKERE